MSLNKIANQTIILKLDNTFYKKAGLEDTIKDYVGAHIDPENKSASIFNALAPGAILMLLRSSPVLGLLISLTLEIFNVDLASIISGIWNSLKDATKNDKPISEDQIQQTAQNVVEQATSQNVQKSSFNQELKIIKYCKLGLSNKYAAVNKISLASILVRVLSVIFKTILASAGLMVAGDVVNKAVGRPNAFDKTLQHGKSTEQPKEEIQSPTPKQTKFKLNTSFSDTAPIKPWVISIPNNEGSIQNLLLNWTNQVYQNVPTQDILNSQDFKTILDKIVSYNDTHQGDNMVFIPNYFKSKKEIIDYFIDDVAGNK